MKSTTLALTTLLATAAIAQPHRQHQHQHVKKDVVWHTDWVSVTETVGITTTIWVDAEQAPATSTASQVSSAVSVAASPSAVAVEAAEVETPSSSSAPAVVPSVVAAPAQVQSSSSSTSVYVAPTTSSSTSVYVAPTTSSSTLAAPTSSASAQSSASSGGSHGQTIPTTPLTGSGHNGIGTGIVTPTCGTAGLADCAGDITYYESADSSAGPSGCGTTNDGTVEKVVALSKDMMGTQSNSGVGDDANPYCGKMVTVVYGGVSVQAKVVDKCWDCAYSSIDLSHAVFSALTPEWETLGRQQATWYFSE
ncbi:Allergen Asp f [Lachnellula subtilissima]|uniref:Allergen Asp f n=1 Tax=Lachnellula subtilissima TaxID=602034 RepID=A0A8H8RKV4_9HELO|nr:Allergen Asp f [Lachnellula subtilissima]